VVSTYERSFRLPGLIAALEAQTLPPEDFEVIIADDGSSDETPAVLEKLAAKTRLDLRILRSERNRGAASARNSAWRASSAPVIAFTDDDCLPTPTWLEAGLAAIGSADVVQGRTMPDPSVPLGSWAVTQRIEAFTDRYETCNIFYRIDVLRTVDGFDEDIQFFGEDTIVGWKARRRGFIGSFAPDALVHHAVAHPGAPHYWRWALQHGNWAALVKRFPEMRREVLWLRLFTKKRHAGFIAAAVGVAAGTVWRPALALAIPYVWYRRPRSLTRAGLVDPLLNSAFDAAVVTGLAIGSVRNRRLVL
jgi:glycosyltransferase involved in cell wall biosynthesis